ncbi:MAG: exodeoxyribonuclease VII small subunit [Kiritimatiellaeota bacterium]|nr:exodeoxyribonuclease VII small subunit [Kiritimatiellota bacterium]
MTQPEDTPQRFETALKRLEGIVAAMESGEMDLDAMIASFAEGQELLRFCAVKLNEVEKKIEALVSSSPDNTATAPFSLGDGK